MPRKSRVSDKKIISTYQSSGSIYKAASILNIDSRTIKRRVQAAGIDIESRDGDIPSHIPTDPDKIKDKCETKIKGDNATVITHSRTIKTADDAIKYAKIDRRIWCIDTVDLNSWEVGGKIGDKDNLKWSRCQLWQVKVKLKRKAKQYITDGIAELIEDLKTYKAPKIKAPKPPKKLKDKDRYMLEISLFDAHFGKIAYDTDPLGTYNTDIAKTIYQNAVEQLLHDSSQYHVDKIIYPIGNDFFNVSNWHNTTYAGTPQDADKRFTYVFDIGCQALIRAIDTCLQVAPVELIWVPGNHDLEISWYMAKFLDAWYRDNDDVTIDLSTDKERKYVQYGATLLGFTHGNEEKHHDLPNIMAGEVPYLWAAATWREWHLGHYHKRKETRYNACDTFNGVQVTVLPSLSATDKWHFKKGYVNGHRSAVGYLWHYENGFKSYINATLH